MASSSFALPHWSHIVSLQEDRCSLNSCAGGNSGYASGQRRLVRQTWQDYSLEKTGHEEDLRTDLQGRVTFPARTVRANLVWRVLGPLASIGGQGVHASFGVHTDMFPLPNVGTKASTEIVQPSPDEIVYRVNL